MQFRAVALVLAETIFRKARAEVAHNRVSGDLGNHTGGGNAKAETIAIDDRRLRQRERENREAVDEDMVGLEAQRDDGSAHRFVSGAQDIDRVNLNRIDNSDCPRDRAVRDQFVIDLFPPLRKQLLGVIQPAMPEFLGKHNRGGYDGARQCAAARFINAGDRGDAKRAQSAFMPETTATVHELVP